jgi:hypothetical protein
MPLRAWQNAHCLDNLSLNRCYAGYIATWCDGRGLGRPLRRAEGRLRRDGSFRDGFRNPCRLHDRCARRFSVMTRRRSSAPFGAAAEVGMRGHRFRRGKKGGRLVSYLFAFRATRPEDLGFIGWVHRRQVRPIIRPHRVVDVAPAPQLAAAW